MRCATRAHGPLQTTSCGRVVCTGTSTPRLHNDQRTIECIQQHRHLAKRCGTQFAELLKRNRAARWVGTLVSVIAGTRRGARGTGASLTSRLGRGGALDGAVTVQSHNIWPNLRRLGKMNMLASNPTCLHRCAAPGRMRDAAPVLTTAALAAVTCWSPYRAQHLSVTNWTPRHRVGGRPLVAILPPHDSVHSFHSPEKEAGGQGAPGGTPTSLTKHVKELTSSVDTVAEGLAGLGRRVDGVATDLGRVREDVALTRQAVAALQAATQDILQRLPAPPPPPATAAGPRQPRAQW